MRTPILARSISCALGLAAALGALMSSRAQQQRTTAVREEPRVITPTAPAPPVAPRVSLNQMVMEAVESMPSGGGYATNAAAIASLKQAIQIDFATGFALRPEAAKPSFCSGATYLVLLAVLDRLHREGKFSASEETLTALRMNQESDGAGVWGRWNANGPGTARLFHELECGRSFSSFSEAHPGDFMKIFWTDQIGSRERGHSVIYMGTVPGEQGEEVLFWSANQPEGYGVKSVPRSKIKRALFTRLENPAAINRVAQLPARDRYLADMLKRPSTEREMFRMVGIPENLAAPDPPPTPAPVKRAPPAATPRAAAAASPSPRSSTSTPAPKKAPPKE